ncbi:MarC family protein [Sphingomonas sp. PR090111-T3T-6A]|uniref:MarC family protein n=1 Tax=Sphingomonas sp. PR090111-T3T-6A TaxID=685778 RepID=UPI0003AAF335|nr:MarC family protein [Sphingomonas sp. PR090111-T3T-6A]
MIALFVSAFVTFFVVIDPPGCAPIFAGLTRGTDMAHRVQMAIRSTLVAAAILLVFALLGEPLLGTLGISLDAFRIAGGIMLFLIALEMVFEKRQQRREERAHEIELHPEQYEDISIFPMAMPMIAGPGSIASVMLMMQRSHGLIAHIVVLGALAVVLAMMMAALLAAGPLMRFLGYKVEAVITRLLGVLLAALAAQFVVDGVRASFGG